MKQQRFTHAMFNENKNSFTGFLKGSGKWLISIAVGIFIILAIFAGITAARPALATNTDWHDNDLSEKIQADAREQARKLWREENGDWQPNLTAEGEKQARAYVIIKQMERNNGH